jgi:hypothetical protein
MVHIHRGQVNYEGLHIVDLPTTPVSPTSGVRTPAMVYAAQMAEYEYLLKGGLSYLNIHSQAFPGGELRAQLLRDKSLPFSTPLDGQDVVPASGAGVTGNVAFFLDPTHTNLSWLLTHNGQEMDTTIDGAAIFKGATAVNSTMPAVCTLLQSQATTPGQDHTQGSCPVGEGGIALADLSGGQLYVQISSGTTGIARGQIIVPPLP